MLLYSAPMLCPDSCKWVLILMSTEKWTALMRTISLFLCLKSALMLTRSPITFDWMFFSLFCSFLIPWLCRDEGQPHYGNTGAAVRLISVIWAWWTESELTTAPAAGLGFDGTWTDRVLNIDLFVMWLIFAVRSGSSVSHWDVIGVIFVVFRDLQDSDN